MTTRTPPPGDSHADARLHHLPVQRIPPTHDYARQLGGAAPTKAPAEGVGPAPVATGLPFVHLHVHSNFSFLDGGSRIEELVARAAELGQPALALTDHDGLYGAVRFARACAKKNIKPIFGAEIRVESLLSAYESPGGQDATASTGGTNAPTGRSAPTAGPDDPYHLVLLAETREGYANLCRLISTAHLADPEREHPPLVTIESLRAHADGIICLTGCRHGEVGHLTDLGHSSEAHEALSHLRDIYGSDHLFVELQYFGYEPHQEARAGQYGSPVYEKVPHVGGRLRHRPASRLTSSDAIPTVGQNATSTTPGHAAPLASATASPSIIETNSAKLHSHCNATPIAFRTEPNGSLEPSRLLPRPSQPLRPDLPAGHPQRLNPADYDIGFHRDGRPWRLSCLTYCLDLVALATACRLPIVLTSNVHYAGETDRSIHLVCRAAGRDRPLSAYPDATPGWRCLQSRVRLEFDTYPLLSLVGSVRPFRGLHYRCIAKSLALYGDGYDHPQECTDHEFTPPSEGPTLGVDACDSPVFHFEHNARSIAHSSECSITGASAAQGASMGLSPLDTAWTIAQRCNVDLELGTYHFPKVDVPTGETAYSLLAKRCFRGIARMYKPVPPRAVELLEKELRMIQQMGFAHYFLVVHDIVRWARAKGIACSGRGSAGNSIVCHALDITASEPIRHNLLFERFLNPNRREMPDIDVDFCSSRRDEVIEHIYKSFGSENVAVVANVNTMSPRSAVRIVAEALGFAPTEINALAKHVPRHGDAARMREYLGGAWPELRDSPLQDEARWGRFLDLVERLDSFPIHLGTHLGGFVIADRPIPFYAPLQWAAKGVVVLQFNKDDIASLGLVKMDILGLRTHSAVSECVHIIRQRTGKRIRPYELPPDDPAAYEIISNGGSIGLFQLESAGQRNLASRLQERDFDDVIAAIALYRPGPLEAEMIGPFIDRRWGLEPVSLPHPAMAEALGDTYGVILYQEQVLRVAQLVAGFDLADADSLRRAMTRDRSREEMAKIGATFISRATARGVSEDAAREVFRQLEGFAAYGFNKSHSVCFAVISYATAYLKAYYPAEFLCAVLNNYPMGFYTPRTVLNDARRFGLEVRPLDINLSGRGFTVEDEKPPEASGGPGLLGTGVNGTPYDPFAQAWTAEHHWGLNESDLAELQAEQEGELAYAENAAPEPPQTGPLSPGDLLPPHAPRTRGGVEPGACLAPSPGIAPDAGRALRVGFSYLRQMGERSLDRIEKERRHGPFESFEDFYLRTRIDYPVAENLIRVGAFDSLEPDRTELLWRLPVLHDRLEALAGSSGQRRGQLRAFFSPPSRTGLERIWSLEDKVRSELELMGLTVSAHPLKLYEEELQAMGVRMSYELPNMGDEVSVTVAGVYERAQNPWMRSGRRTMFLTLEDAYGLFECVCFESKLAKIAPVVARASYFLVRGRLQNNHKRGLAIVAEEVFDLEDVLAKRRARKAPGTGTTAIPKKVG